MPYQIDPHVDLQNHYRGHAPEYYYIRQLSERGKLIQLDNILVDAEMMVERVFQCDIHWCLRCSGEGTGRKFNKSCCTDLEVDLTKGELELLQELRRRAEQSLTMAPRDPLAPVMQRLKENNFTNETEKGETELTHLKNGRCPLSWMDKDGALRCGINSLCQRLGLPLAQYKPDPCYLFPLHYVEHEPGKYLLTIISPETYKFVGADAYVPKLRCLAKPQPGAPPAYLSLKWEIIYCLGQDFYRNLELAVQTWQGEAAGNGANGE